MPCKISYVMNVVNGEPFLKYQLTSIYSHAHEIIIVEGAYTRYKHAATPEGHSLDRTVEIIRTFPDPEHKIKLVQREGFWDDLCDMCNAFLPPVTGDVIWQVDADEFYMPETHRLVNELMSQNPLLDRISFKAHDFYFSLGYQLAGGPEVVGMMDIKRVHRYQTGEIWVTQRPPTLGDTAGNPKVLRQEITADEMLARGHFMYHPTVLFRHQFYNKFRYYRQLWRSIPQTDAWLDGIWQNFDNPLNIMGMGTLATWIRPYHGPPPPVELQQLVDDVAGGGYPGYELRNNTDLDTYMQTWIYRWDVWAGRCLNYIQTERRWYCIPYMVAAMGYLVLFSLGNFQREPGKFCLYGLKETGKQFLKRIFRK